MQETEKRKSLRHNLREVEGMSLMLADELDTGQCFYFLKINFVPSWDEVLRCNLHQSKM